MGWGPPSCHFPPSPSLSCVGGDTAGGTSPTITEFTPTSGSVGTSVAISGTNFTGATAVAFNGVSASFTVTSDTAIEATVPEGATTGPLSVTTPGAADVHPQRQQSEPSDRRWYRDLQLQSRQSRPDCGPTCSASYGYGTVVTLTATPGFLSIFDSWNGCDTVSDTICTVTVNAARSVTANFLP